MKKLAFIILSLALFTSCERKISEFAVIKGQQTLQNMSLSGIRLLPDTLMVPYTMMDRCIPVRTSLPSSFSSPVAALLFSRW